MRHSGEAARHLPADLTAPPAAPARADAGHLHDFFKIVIEVEGDHVFAFLDQPIARGRSYFTRLDVHDSLDAVLQSTSSGASRSLVEHFGLAQSALMNRKQRRAAAKLGKTTSNPLGETTAAAVVTPGHDELLGAGLKHQQMGRLAEAEACYRRVLAARARPCGRPPSVGCHRSPGRTP